jgi:hypothetical protein
MDGQGRFHGLNYCQVKKKIEFIMEYIKDRNYNELHNSEQLAQIHICIGIGLER